MFEKLQKHFFFNIYEQAGTLIMKHSISTETCCFIRSPAYCVLKNYYCKEMQECGCNILQYKYLLQRSLDLVNLIYVNSLVLGLDSSKRMHFSVDFSFYSKRDGFLSFSFMLKKIFLFFFFSHQNQVLIEISPLKIYLFIFPY